MLFGRRRKKEADPDALVHENWKANFGLLGEKRFSLDENEAYQSIQEKGRLSLCLKRKNLFAWALDPVYKYNDFMLEAELEFTPDTPYGAMGFLFRYLNDENFYYFLISTRGYFRFDLVFNGNPIPCINWTYSPLITKEKNNLMILAHGSHFSFYIDDEWVGEMNDDTLPEGRLGFTAQNFDEAAPMNVHLSQFTLESRPLEVEKAYARWTDVVPGNPEYRILLAKTFFSMGNFTAAAIQMKKALKRKKPGCEDYLFLAENLLNLGIYDTALKFADKALELEPKHAEALQEKGNLLYLQNRFLEARDYLKEILPGFNENASLWNLAGNCEYALGNWQAAAEDYGKACELDKENSLFLMNQARALDRAGQKEEALSQYLAASYILFYQESYGDLYNILPRVINLDPENKRVKAFQAKMFYHENRKQEAAEIIAPLIEAGYEESAIFYLGGLWEAETGDQEKALELLEKACQLEPGFYLNWYKLAENRFFCDLDPGEALRQASQLKPDYPWTINLQGLLCLKNENPAEAAVHFRQALNLAPGEADILLNLSEALFRNGDKEAAYQILENSELEDEHRLRNHKGNLYTREEAYEEAMREYEKALRMDPGNLTYMENLAGVCIELEMIMRAEELLLKLYDQNPTASVLNLVGKVADMKREYKRAEVAYTEALNLKPGDLTLRCQLAGVFLSQLDYKRTKEMLTCLEEEFPDSEEVAILLNRMRRLYEEKHSCAACGREWWVPRDLPIQPPLRLVAEPPAAAPAGQCPACGNVFCIGCRKDELRDDRFTCPDCGDFLKLPAPWLKYLLREAMEKASGEEEQTLAGNPS